MTKLNETEFTVFKICRFSLFLKDLFFQIILKPEVDVTFYHSKKNSDGAILHSALSMIQRRVVSQCMCGSRGGDRGSRPPLKNHKNIGLLSNTGLDPLKNHKAIKPTFNVGPTSARQCNAI